MKCLLLIVMLVTPGLESFGSPVSCQQIVRIIDIKRNGNLDVKVLCTVPGDEGSETTQECSYKKGDVFKNIEVLSGQQFERNFKRGKKIQIASRYGRRDADSEYERYWALSAISASCN